MKNKFLMSLLILSSVFMFSCGGGESEETTDDVSTEMVADESGVEEMATTDNANEAQSCGFAIESKEDFLSYVLNGDMPKTFETKDGEYLFFRADGSMGGGGMDGEPTLWEADWMFQPGTPTGQIVFTITTEPTTGTALSGAYNVEMFPDDGALILNCVDYLLTEY